MKLDPAHLEIRPLDPGDFDQLLAIAEIVEEAPHWSRGQFEGLLPGDLLPDAPGRSRLALVACHVRTPKAGGGEILGFAVAGLIPPEAELESIAVLETARRHGVGRRLFASLVTMLRAKGISALHLEVRASNHGALAFYLAQGFNQSGIRPRYYADPEEDAILMTLRLR
jgi:[ribosomal protein S18]-alanine N-acetyltransferase